MTEYHVGDVIRIREDAGAYFHNKGMVGKEFVVVKADEGDHSQPVQVARPDGGIAWPLLREFDLVRSVTQGPVVPTIPGLKVVRDEDGDLAIQQGAIEGERFGRVAQLIDPDRNLLPLDSDGIEQVWRPGHSTATPAELRDIAAIYLAFADALEAEQAADAALDPVVDALEQAEGIALSRDEIAGLLRLAKELGYDITKTEV